MKKYLPSLSLFLLLTPLLTCAQSWWHNKERAIQYTPRGEDFVCENGSRRFNRALYGANTAFRVEAGDLPEFALYMPGMGGNFKFGLIAGAESKWLTRAEHIKTIYRPGSMLYEVKDALLGKGTLHITVLALADAEGMIIQARFENTPAGVELLWAFGGASGKKFSRDGDIGADPESSFYLQPDYCKDNQYTIDKNSFRLLYGTGKTLTETERYEINHLPSAAAGNEKKNPAKQLAGIFPNAAILKKADANSQQSPSALFQSGVTSLPVITGKTGLTGKTIYFLIQNAAYKIPPGYTELPTVFQRANTAREQLASRVKLVTPDPYINTLGGALAVASDAIWEDPSYLHGAVAWRMRLNAWRGAYAADPLGWHDRARRHFSSYALSQLTTPLTGPVIPDTVLHLARQLEKIGTSLFSSGYICRNPNGDIRPHHYDMNLVFVDQLLNHFKWTGDTAYVRQLWPLLQRHLAWEKRNFDADNDGLYDAYAAIWASDALQYSGGGVTHSSAYNYRANAMAAKLAEMIGEDPRPYREEADKIRNAVNSKLWIPQDGVYAEYKDLLGMQLLHPAAGLWTVYHAIDSKLPDGFETWQSLRYVSKEIPHIPVRANGLKENDLYMLSTTNWQPYTWSVNNVALAENLHTALSFWQGNRADDAFRLWKSALVESMYLGASPGNFEQLSFYDAIRGELYRDFADPVGMAARSLVEGLFGIVPDALQDTLSVSPGLPSGWDHASLQVPDMHFEFSRTGDTDRYELRSFFNRQMNLKFSVPARKAGVAAVLVNGRPAAWQPVAAAVGAEPRLRITAGKSDRYHIVITWREGEIDHPAYDSIVAEGAAFTLATADAELLSFYDPQGLFNAVSLSGHRFSAVVNRVNGNKTAFVRLKQGDFTWWAPVNLLVKKQVSFSDITSNHQKGFTVKVENNTANAISGKLLVSAGENRVGIPLRINPDTVSGPIAIPAEVLVPGSNRISFEWNSGTADTLMLSWDIAARAGARFDKMEIAPFFNDKVSNIFQHNYLSPRPATPTLQLPVQGIGNWCYPLVQADIDDSGSRKLAGPANNITSPQGIPFATPSDTMLNNIVFISQWDNFPKQVMIPLYGTASHAYLLMAGSTNPMQSRLLNGEVIITYQDGSADTLALRNPQNWWPVEQDFYIDGYAFVTGTPPPLRLYLKEGRFGRGLDKYSTIKGFTSMAVEGGAANVLDIPLNGQKKLKYLTLRAIANDVVIGLMSVTLVRN
jgi:hypothetical protein